MDVPREFFKYRDLSGAESLWVERTICHHEIYLGSPEQFNDPFDCLPIFDMAYTEAQLRALAQRVITQNRPGICQAELESEIERFLSAASGFDPSAASGHMRQAHIDQVKSVLGVYCVADKSDNLLMWSHYANSHRGICLGFDPERFPFDVAQKVEYKKARERILPSDDNNAKVVKALLSKSSDWGYEGEWRIIDPYNGIGVKNIHPRALISIVFGARISDKDRQTVEAWARTRTYQPRLLQAHISTENFEVEVHPA